jgi:hypothetical protein
VLWSFGAKYWIVAYKIQLMQAEIKIDTKARLFFWLLFGGCAAVTLLNTIACIPYLIALIDDFKDTPSTIIYFNYIKTSQTVIIVCSILLLIDGFRRIFSALKEGESIRKRFIFALIFIYCVGLICGILYYVQQKFQLPSIIFSITECVLYVI